MNGFLIRNFCRYDTVRFEIGLPFFTDVYFRIVNIHICKRIDPRTPKLFVLKDRCGSKRRTHSLVRVIIISRNCTLSKKDNNQKDINHLEARLNFTSENLEEIIRLKIRVYANWVIPSLVQFHAIRPNKILIDWLIGRNWKNKYT